MLYDLTAAGGCDAYDLLTQAVIPRPIAWILSENEDGSLNLAPFSYFNIVASRPVLFSVAIGVRADASPKDTRRNLCAGRACVLHVPGVAQIDAVNQSSVALPSGTSEVAAQGLATTPFGDFPLPRLVGPAVAFGGRLKQEVTFEGVAQGLLIIEAERAYVDPSVLQAEQEGSPTLDPARLKPLARLGRTAYAGIGDLLHRDRPG